MNQNYVNKTSSADRDALESFFLGKNIANNPAVRTKEDLYAHLLTDTRVSNLVKTSKIGEGIASLQLYINRVLKGLEPDIKATPKEAKKWERLSQYAVWAGYQQLSSHPENFIIPTLRKNKSDLFEELESRLSQGGITDDGVQAATSNFLSRLEELNNLDTIAVYQDGLNIEDSTFYFIGCSKTSNYRYYWRSLDMTKRTGSAIHPDAWTIWKEITGLVGAIKGTVQPVFMNKRLYIAWCEAPKRVDRVKIAGNTEGKEEDKESYDFTVKLAYKSIDGTWSSPKELFKGNNRAAPAHLIAVNNIKDSHNHLLHLTLLGAPNHKATDSEKVGIAIKKAWEFIERALFTGKTGQNEAASPLEYEWIVTKTYDALLNEITYDEKNKLEDQKFYDLSIRKPYSTDATLLESKAGDPQTVYMMYPDRTLSGTFEALHIKFVEATGADKSKISLVPHFKMLGRPENPDATISYELRSHTGAIATGTASLGNLILGTAPPILVDFEQSGEFYLIIVDEEAAIKAAMLYCSPSPSTFTIKVASVASIQSDLTLHTSADLTQWLTPTDAKPVAGLPIRLNTLFAKELVQRAETGIDGLYTSVQPLIDFNAAHGRYMWELYVHVPFLVAHLLNQEQRYAEATRWLHYLFNPFDCDNPWKLRPLAPSKAEEKAEFIGKDVFDPDLRAMAEPLLYRKAVFFAYLKNLIDEGDANYRKLTRDGLASAKQFYMQALALLGPQPEGRHESHWKVQTVAEAFKADTARRRTEEQEHPHKQHTGIFMLPRNLLLDQYWVMLNDRMHNLREGLGLNGQVLSLPLFDTPIPPGELLSGWRADGDLGGNEALGPLKVPPYRYSYMSSKAFAFTDSLIQLGSTMLGMFERKDSTHLDLMQQEQQHELLAAFTINLQQESIALSITNQAALKISKDAATKRAGHYDKLLQEPMSKLERLALASRAAGIGFSALSSALRIDGGAADLVPDVAGTSFGGSVWGAPFYATSIALAETGNVLINSGYAMETKASYVRREEDWKMLKAQADSDVEQITKQIEAEKKQHDIQVMQLRQLKAQQVQVKNTLNFLSTRFTGESLYNWMSGQLSSLYLLAYDGVMALCLATEAAWQNEVGLYDGPRFIQPGAFKNRWHGLTAGESLRLGLQRMDLAYLTRNERKLEIVHTVSIKALKARWKNTDNWKSKLVEEGVLDFELREEDFAERYPNLFLRQIASISVSLPALVGAYQDVRATLSQTESHFSTKPEIEAVKYLAERLSPTSEKKLEKPASVRSNLRANQQIALSTGIDDNGCFQLGIDERLNPFEGNGVVSRWRITFPNPGNPEQREMLKSLSDVIIRVRYTARDGGNDHAQVVIKELNAASPQEQLLFPPAEKVSG